MNCYCIAGGLYYYYGDQSIDSDFCTVYVATSIDEQFKRELPIKKYRETIALDATCARV